MQAAFIRDYNEPIEVGQLPEPEILPDSVLIQVHATSLNPFDSIIRSGELSGMLQVAFPYIMGNDLSGTVLAVGKNVHKFKKGDEVFSRPHPRQAGTLAEYCLVREEDLAFKPQTISHLEAASLPLVGLTAWQALKHKGQLRKGQWVLIHAGSGGVGTVAIQMAKTLGAKVATTTSSRNADLVRELGADIVIDYRSENFEEILSDYDLVFDLLGGEVLNRSFKVVKNGGRIISIKGEDPDGLAKKYGVHFELLWQWQDSEMLIELARQVDSRKLKPVIDRIFTLDQAAEAYEYIQSGRARGKVVIQVRKDL